MDPKDFRPKDESNNDAHEVRRVGSGDVSTETIDVEALLGPELTSSSSFNFKWLKQAAFGRLLEAVPLPVLLVDTSHTIVFSNQALEKISEEHSKLKGTSFESIFADPAAASRAESSLHDILIDRKPKNVEGRLTILGSKIWGRVHLRSIRVREQRLVLVLVEDLTAEKKELLLNAKYRDLVHLLPTGIAEFSLTQTVSVELPESEAIQVIMNASLIDGNEEFAKIHGYPSIEGLVGIRLGDLPTGGVQTDGLFRKWLQRGFAASSEEIVIELEDHSPRYLETTVIGIVRNGGLQGFWLLKRDVTEDHDMKEQVFRIQKLESLSLMARGVAHDFNNSLTAILGNINLAKIRSTAGDPALQRLEEAERACNRAKRLTEQLQTFAKGGKPVKKVGFVSPLLTECVAFALRGSNVGHEFAIHEEVWPVEFDEGQLSQVIHNLVINAQQAMPEGGIVRVAAENLTLAENQVQDLPQGDYVRISVSDRGVGIPPEHLSRVFDPYFTTKKKGSGLGLATSYSIIKSHQGTMTAESEASEGATFHVYLPASRSSLPDSAQQTEPRPSGKKQRILVVEEEKMVRDVADEMLRLIGYDVECVGDGSEGIDLYRKSVAKGEPFAAVMMSAIVPGGMGAKETLAALLEIDPHVRAILSSGFPDDPMMDNFAQYGFKAVASKPYNLGDLSNILSRVIGETG